MTPPPDQKRRKVHKEVKRDDGDYTACDALPKKEFSIYVSRFWEEVTCKRCLRYRV